MSKKTSDNYKEDFAVFLDADTSVPDAVSNRIRQSVHQSLFPSSNRVFISLAAVHLFAGSLTLLVCPQFGIGPIGGWVDFMQFLMPLGIVACATFCGAIYLGTTAIATHLFLSPEMLRALEKTRYAQFSLLGAISMATLMLISLPSGFVLDIGFSILWLIGGIIISQGTFHFIFRLRNCA